MSANKGGFPAWAWIGCGCLGSVAALLVLALAVGVWSMRKVRELGERLADPAEREEMALAVLGADEIPEGYNTVVAFSVPFVFDLAVLSDQRLGAEGSPPEIGLMGFIFMSFPGWVQPAGELRDFFEGRSDDVEMLRRQRMDVDLEERLAGGTISRDEDELLWACHRGRVDPEDAGSPKEGLVTLLLIDCDGDGDERHRLGVWFGPDPAPSRPAGEVDLEGTVGDPAELERFLSPIRPCRGS